MKDVARRMKLDSSRMAATSLEQRNAALLKLHDVLQQERETIFAANQADLAAAEAAGIAPAVAARLRFDQHKLDDVCSGIKGLIQLEDPLGKNLLNRELDEGLELERISCPIGVIGVIFEARPDALVQISSLCLKSGNCAILKGGSETARTNRAIFSVVYKAALDAGLPENCLYQAEGHSEIDELLDCFGLVDLLIPRGSNAFVRHIMDNTKIPVMGHADGICHIYVDASADVQKSVAICVDAKCQYTAACNAVETLLVHKNCAAEFLPQLARAYAESGVSIRGDERTRDYIACEPATELDWDTEYLALTISIKIVDSLDEAIEHINLHGSHHTDAILSEDAASVERFMQLVDSAGVYHNASTRFADGFRYGFGAEVGISTSKLHARGPVGLDGLVTYKYRLHGQGHIVGDYAEGKKHFHFKDK